MKILWEFFKIHLFSDFRNRRSIFWVIIFPVLLLSLLILTFSNLGVRGSLNFNVIVIDESGDSGMIFSQKMVDILKSLSFPNKDGVFNLTVMSQGDESKAIKSIMYGESDLLIIIPKNFDSQIAREVLLQKIGFNSSPATVETYYLPNRASSSLAQGLIEGFIGQFNIFFAKNFGQAVQPVKVKNKTLGGIIGSPSYTDFVTPGILVIAPFTTGLLLVAPKLAMMRRNRIMKRYNSTPMNLLSFFFGFTFSRLLIMILQYAGLALFAFSVMKTQINLFSPSALIYYLFSCAVYTAIGFAVGYAVSGPVAVSALSSVVNLPLEFLAGIFFPLFNLSWYIQIFVYANPLWYATNAMRQFLGVSISPSPMWMNIFVPGLWLFASLSFSLVKSLNERR